MTVEASDVEVAGDGLRAAGVQLGADPLPYRLDYRLDAARGWITRTLDLEASGDGWRRTLALSRGTDGRWAATSTTQGEAELPTAGGALDGLDDALDCDLMRSPLTNLMPVRRHRLDRDAGALDLITAWVSVPDLVVHAYPQRYEHVRSDRRGAVVRFIDRGPASGFVAELRLDTDGLVVDYPELATRL
jgi:uncharacterized protein